MRAGAEVVIESDKLPVAVVHAPAPPRRTISECIALLPEDSTAVMDSDFAKDVEAAIQSVATMMANLIDVIGESLLSLFGARDSYDVAERFVIQVRSQKEARECPVAFEGGLHHQRIDVTVNEPISATI